MPGVLLIDDNALDRKIIRDSLCNAGFHVLEAGDGSSGLRLLFDERPDVVLLDVIMPEMDGWTVCQRIREICSTPIIMLTSLNSEEEMIRGLNLGADDFVSKPISPAQLTARVQAVLRRAQSPALLEHDEVYDDGSLVVDAARHRVLLDNKSLDLTPTEFRLLIALARRPGQVQAFASLLATVWGPEYVDDIDFLRVYVWRLRKKIERDSEKPHWIRTERGFGYRFAEARGTSP